MLPAVFRYITGQYFPTIDATLYDWKRCRIHDETFPAATPVAGESIEGILWLGVSAPALERLDNFEGGDYRRITVKVFDRLGQVYPAQIYAWAGAETLVDEPWDVERFKQKDLKEFMRKHLPGLSEHFSENEHTIHKSAKFPELSYQALPTTALMSFIKRNN